MRDEGGRLARHHDVDPVPHEPESVEYLERALPAFRHAGPPGFPCPRYDNLSSHIQPHVVNGWIPSERLRA